MKKSFFSMTPQLFASDMTAAGFSSSCLRRLMSSIFRQESPCFPTSSEELGPREIKYLNDHYCLQLPKIAQAHASQDGTHKFLIEFSDGNVAEMVAMNFHKKYTLCLSSQVGCAMKCSFCFTGTQGLKRNLKAHEIVGQYIVGRNYVLNKLGSVANPNIVFMGQGEPLHNFNELKSALEVLTSVPGIQLGPKQITVSTVGFLPGLKRFNELPPVHLALSLHNSFDEERSKLIPMNEKFSMRELMDVLKGLGLHGRKRVNIEYLLLKGVNDSKEHADELNKYASQIPFFVNIIPFNPYPGAIYERPSDEEVETFKSYLVSHKIRTMVRTTRGDDILAACGQLANKV